MTPIRPSRMSALWLCLAALPLGASGFQLREQSASSQGCAFAGVSAGGEDISAMFFNPAVLTRFAGGEAVAGASLVRPIARLDDAQGQRGGLFPAPLRPISGSGHQADAGRQGALPLVYASWSLGPDLRAGFSINSPFGLASDYAPGWTGRYHALESRMTIVEVAPVVAWRVAPGWSVGAALTARHVDATLSNAVDFGAIGAALGVPGSVPGGQDGKATVTGSRWGMGWHLGVLWEPTDTLRLGGAWQSAMDFRLKGDIRYEGVPAAMASRFPNGSARPMASQPATASLGAAWTPGKGPWTFQAEAARTLWSRFKEIRIAFASGQADAVTKEDWRDSWFLSVGATWRPAGPWTLRAGVARDQSPARDAERTPRIPDASRTWASLGLGLAISRSLSLDLGLSHLFVDRATLNLQAGSPGDPDFFRGTLTGTYHSEVDIIALQGRYRF